MDDRPYILGLPARIVRTGAPWPAGVWDDEPDFDSWIEPETGYRCCAMRHPQFGSWCGYVRVTPDSLLAGMDKDDRVELPPGWGDKRKRMRLGDDLGPLDMFIEALSKHPGHPLRLLLAVHGGISYCEDDWWGFDCGHAEDYAPGLMAIVGDDYRRMAAKYQYRTLPYVRHECTQLAWQLKELGDALAAVAKEKLAC